MAKIESVTGVSKWEQIDKRGQRNAFGLAQGPPIATKVERRERKQPARSRAPTGRTEVPVPLSVRGAVDRPTAERLWKASLARRLSPQED
eukprot:7714331-Pyramimonas_sp.AAC.2